MKYSVLFSLFLITLINNSIFSQDVSFAFANAQNTNDGSNDFYEVDVMISSTSGFKLGSGLLYFNYNTAAFGTNVNANGGLTVTQPTGSVLAELVFGMFPFYQ